MGEGISAYILRVSSGLIFSAPNGAPRVKYRIRPKSEIFRISKIANPQVQNRTRTQNPRISAPNLIRCHPYKLAHSYHMLHCMWSTRDAGVGPKHRSLDDAAAGEDYACEAVVQAYR